MQLGNFGSRRWYSEAMLDLITAVDVIAKDLGA